MHLEAPSIRNVSISDLWKQIRRTGILVPALLLVVLFTLAPHLDPHDWDYDEGINLVKALLVTQGYEMFTDIWSDQPPLFTLILAAIFRMTGPSVTAGRILVMLFSALLVWSLFMAVRSTVSTLAAVASVTLLVLSEYYLLLSGALMLGLPSLALGTFALMLLIIRRQSWPWLLAAAVVMALTLQIKLMAAVILPACMMAIMLPTRRLTAASSIGQRFLTLTGWSLSVVALYLVLGLLMGALHFDLLLGAPFGDLTRSVQNFVLSSGFFLPHFVEQHVAYLIIAAGGLVYAGVCRRTDVFVPLAWFVVGVAAFTVHRPLWYHHTLVLTLPLSWLCAYGVAGWWAAFKAAWLHRGSWPGLAASGLLMTIACAVLVILYAYPLPWGERWGWQMNLYRPAYVDAAADQLAADSQDKTAFVFTDHAFYAFKAGIVVPPPIAVLSSKALNSGIITQEMLLDVLRNYKPEFVLLERFTDTYSSRFGHFSCWLRRINGETIIDGSWYAKESQDRFLQIRQWRQVAKSLPIGDDLR